ncbi:MAG: aspartate aminotransferase family protein [Nitrososphaerota archaeon]|jgi:acetylornithine/LysW-gamma-L-lysine aminotransferase|nr:aspartate aminotransferase family protein [Nitrososphaerota archaeon]MDG6971732.1 aspartate aminotransferase family protein [Nitrososphaerota archaeon]MDG6973744.1 aspartate aminotransferase family protein [Nitrososphaerota archaeon]MDG6976559.1 aspartate aminotransferase family protein [Nitrososphaerota archaeon]MDG6981880.1 aspartate aminotransferase family protein [Nitrososphaerota archaeon]
MTELIRSLEDSYEAHAFNKFPLAIVRGKGSLVWDSEGKEYIDFMSGIGVALVGHCNDSVIDAVREQVGRLITCHGSYYNDARAGFVERLAKAAPKGLGRVLLTSTGTESVEAAIKLARRHTARKKVVAMKGAFHGKTYGSLSATWSKKYRDPFGPLLEGFGFAEYADAKSLESLVDGDTAAVIAEPIQGESGIIVPPDGYFREVREICDRNGALLIFDEIQSGLGRTGKMWASEHWGVVPDIMTVSKGLGGGLPIGAAIATDEVAGSLKGGEHTSTFAGNPLSCAAGSATLDYIARNDLPARAREKGEALKSGLAKVASAHRLVKEVRGLGLMLALQTRVDIHSMLLAAQSRGVITAYSGRDTFRLLPPLVVEDAQMARGLEVLDRVMAEAEAGRF